MQQQFYEQPSPSERQQQQQRAIQGTMFAPISRRRSTLNNILYLLLSLPLGIVYFVLLVTGLSMGFGMLAIWVGFPILYITLLIWLGLASFERQLTMSLLNIYIPPMSSRLSYDMSWWQSFRARLTNPVTWKSLAYLLVKFPFGIFSFTLTVTLMVTSIAFILMPVAYLVDTLLLHLSAIPAHTINVLTFGKQAGYNILVDGQIRASSLLELLVVMIIGIALFFVSRIILNFIAYLWGEFARFMLSRNNVGQPLDAREGDFR
jgi:hypothetical protein